MLLALVEPRYLLPIGGTIRHMRSYSVLAQKMGWNKEQVFELRQGDVVEFTKEGARKAKSIPVKSILVDGLGVGDVGEVVLRDRKTLAKEGIVIVVAQVSRGTARLLDNPEIISRGFVFEKNQQQFLERASREVAREIRKRASRGNGRLVKDTIRTFLENFFFLETGRHPMILPVVVEV
jgi:ribonuclease J